MYSSLITRVSDPDVDPKSDSGLGTSNEGKFSYSIDRRYKMFHTFGVMSSVSHRAPVPVRILKDPGLGWFSGYRISMKRLTSIVWKQKGRFIE